MFVRTSSHPRNHTHDSTIKNNHSQPSRCLREFPFVAGRRSSATFDSLRIKCTCERACDALCMACESWVDILPYATPVRIPGISGDEVLETSFCCMFSSQPSGLPCGRHFKVYPYRNVEWSYQKRVPCVKDHKISQRDGLLIEYLAQTLSTDHALASVRGTAYSLHEPQR